MVRTRFIFGLLMILMLVAGCEMTKSEKDQLLFSKVDEIKLQIEQEEWKKALSNSNEFKNKFEQRKWKMQLLGAQGNYQGIELEIELLKDSVKKQDELMSIQSLTQLKHHLSVIYDF